MTGVVHLCATDRIGNVSGVVLVSGVVVVVFVVVVFGVIVVAIVVVVDDAGVVVVVVVAAADVAAVVVVAGVGVVIVAAVVVVVGGGGVMTFVLALVVVVVAAVVVAGVDVLAALADAVVLNCDDDILGDVLMSSAIAVDGTAAAYHQPCRRRRDPRHVTATGETTAGSGYRILRIC